VTGAKRNPALPAVPTVLETGVTKLEVVNKLSQAFKETLDSPEIQKKMIEKGADPVYLNAEQFTKFLSVEMSYWAKAVKQAGAKLD